MFRHHFQNRTTTIHNRPVWDGCLAAWCCALRTASKGHKKQRILKAEKESKQVPQRKQNGWKKCHKMRKFFSSHPIHFMTLVRFLWCVQERKRNKLPYDYIYGVCLLKRTHIWDTRGRRNTQGKTTLEST